MGIDLTGVWKRTEVPEEEKEEEEEATYGTLTRCPA